MDRTVCCLMGLLAAMFLSPGNVAAQRVPIANGKASPQLQNPTPPVDSDLATAIQNAFYKMRPATLGFEANNASQDLYAQFMPGALKITSGANTLQLRLLDHGKQLKAKTDGWRLDRQYEGLREWFVNSPAGIEQGFVLERAPQKPAIRIAVDGGWQTKVEHDTLTFTKGESTLQYGDLKAWDARGTPLAARLQPMNGGFEVKVDAQGAVYPITVDPVLTQQTTLTGISGQPYFGNSVALSGDGNTALVGATETTINGNANQGAAFIFTRSDGVWTQQVELTAPTSGDAVGGANEQFGFSVALSENGDTAVVSAFGQTIGSATNAGAVFVYTFDGTSWNQSALLAQDIAGEGFGQYVAISGDGSTVLIHGGIDSTAYIYGPIATSVGYLSGLGLEATLEAETSTTNFGESGGLSYDGSVALIGQDGAFSVYTRNGALWSLQQEVSFVDLDTTMGSRAALSDSGTTALIADYLGQEQNAYIYTNQGGVWTQQATLNNPSLEYQNGNFVNQFGWQVSLSHDGTKALIGDVGALGPSGVRYGGAVSLFAYNGSSWSLAQYIDDPAAGTSSFTPGQDFFGYSVALNSNGTTALIGAPPDSLVYVYYDVNVTINSSPQGLQFTSSGDAGCSPGSYTTPATLAWTPGDTCVVAFATPQPGPLGTQYVFASWADVGASASRQIVAPSASTSYTAEFTTQYQLTTLALPSGEGSISPSTGYFNAGSTITVTAISNPGDVFTGFSGALTGTTNPQTITLNAPGTVSANFETLFQAIQSEIENIVARSSLPPQIKALILDILEQLPTGTGVLTAAQRSAAIVNMETLAAEIRLLLGSQANQATSMINQGIAALQSQ